MGDWIAVHIALLTSTSQVAFVTVLVTGENVAFQIETPCRDDRPQME